MNRVWPWTASDVTAPAATPPPPPPPHTHTQRGGVSQPVQGPCEDSSLPANTGSQDSAQTLQLDPASWVGVM